MLKYHDLSPSEREMVNREIDSNFNSSAKSRTIYKKLLQDVHNDLKCCNCFRTMENCCCDKIEDCFGELFNDN